MIKTALTAPSSSSSAKGAPETVVGQGHNSKHGAPVRKPTNGPTRSSSAQRRAAVGNTSHRTVFVPPKTGGTFLGLELRVDALERQSAVLTQFSTIEEGVRNSQIAAQRQWIEDRLKEALEELSTLIILCKKESAV